MGSRSDSQAWSSAEKGLMLSAVILITLSAFESLATTTIMPNVVASFHADSWFAVASGAALITNLIANVLAGGLSDAIGVKRVFAWGLILFCVGLLISAFAPHIGIFVLGRLVQGLGGGFIIVPLYVLVGAIATPLHRPRYFAAFSLSWVFPALVGPALAGFIATYCGWRIVFGVAPFLAIFGAIPLHSVLKGLVSTPQGRLPSARFLRLALGSGLGVFLLQISGTFQSVWAMTAVGALGFALSIFTLPRLLPKGTFRLKRGIPALVMTRLLMMGAVTGAEVVMPLLLQRIHGWSANTASLAVTIATLSWASGAFIQSQFKTRRVRLLLPKIGSCMIVIGLAPLSMLLNPSLPKWPVFIAWLLSGIGVGFTHSTISDLTLGSTDPSMHGRASSWLQVADSAGAAVELAFVSLALALWNAIGFTGPIAYLPATLIALGVAVVGAFAAMRTREEDLLPRACAH